PVHIPVFSHLFLSNYRYVVLCMTSDHTSPTSCTGIQVNRHFKVMPYRTVKTIPQVNIRRSYRSFHVIKGNLRHIVPNMRFLTIEDLKGSLFYNILSPHQGSMKLKTCKFMHSSCFFYSNILERTKILIKRIGINPYLHLPLN